MSNPIPFKEIELSDKEWADPLLAVSDYRATEYCFTTLYIWAGFFGTRIARHRDWLMMRSEWDKDSLSYIFPAGNGDVREILDLIEEDAAACGKKAVVWAVSGAAEKIEAACPGMYEFTPVRKSFDYIYETERMISLSGKKYQPKRNFISRFKTLYPDWTYEDITSGGQIDECLEMTDRWCAVNGCSHDKSMQMEACAVRSALNNFGHLRLKGGLLRTGGKVVAYTLGEQLNSDTFIVHVEKAFSDVTGAYPMINRTFLEHEAGGLTYVNREDDTGDEGLRKAKLSYHPVFMLEKYLAIRR
ncbi:MAG TPA: DUF2156 domain-containing protein [Candidatus Coprenecus stercoravium]|uniref:DUF2156 domain-containing protein n=1 Tax=Candidatus Coprenecus stercoravium TaxID=2840735 RepID=A0A9D2K9H8_9BACT|nr:DUF2156 domain-containing protein [Candidatus Coprenecus stercoravium]